MAFSLIDETPGAVPVALVTKDRLPAWLAEAPERERNWVTAIGFAADAGKLGLVPGEDGGLARVLVGLGEAARRYRYLGLRRAAGRAAGRQLPARGGPRRRRPDPARARLGARHLCLHPLPRESPGAPPRWFGPRAPTAAASSGWRGAVFLARDLVNTPAADLGPAELAAEAARVAEAAGACYRIIVGDELLAENYPTIHAVGRASTRAPRLVDIIWGDPAAPKVTLVGKGVCFDTGGLDLKPASGMRQMKKDMAGAAIMLGPRPGDHGREAAGAAAGAAAAASRTRSSGNAMRPLDIVRTRKGLTVEIGNTDAEGPPDPVRRAGRGLDREAGAAGRHGDADRRGAGGARPRTGRHCSATTTRSPARCSPPPRRRTTRCGGCRCGGPTAGCSTARSPTSTTSRMGRMPAPSPPRSTSRNLSSPASPGRISM